MLISSPYRPHNPGHDYYEAGAYLVTLVVTERERSLGTLGTDARQPSVALSPTGRIVSEEWEKTALLQREKGRKIRTLAQVCMPDHWHGVIVVEERMDIPLGRIIQSFKSACTARWRREVTGYVQPSSSDGAPSLAHQLARMSKEARRTYYASRPRIERPLFDDDYDDTICIDAAHLQRMLAYVADNPRRAILRHQHPQFMQRCLHVIIGGEDYAAFGNLFLLRWANKLQVFCHRKARLAQLSPAERQQHGYTYDALPTLTTSVPYESTLHFQHQREAWISQILAGATVLVTPGISKGELTMKNDCLSHGYPLIHLQAEPIGPYWKPEQSRFEACANGRLLILAPWHLDDKSPVNGIPATSAYSRFHNLNTLAAQICSFDGEARIVGL